MAATRCSICNALMDPWLVKNGWKTHVGCFEEPRPKSAQQLRDEGAGLALSHESEGWKRAARDELLNLAATGLEFSAEDLRAKVGDPERAQSMGAVFLAASKAGLITSVETRVATRTERHSGVLRVWKGTEKARRDVVPPAPRPAAEPDYF